MLAFTSMFADEWQKPVYSGDFLDKNTDDTLYIFNVESKQFLTKGNNWGTHASVSETGMQFFINHVNDTSFKIEAYDKSEGTFLFITDLGHMYVDGREGTPDSLFQMKAVGDNTFQLCGSNENPTWRSTDDMEGYLVGQYTEYNNERDNVVTGTGVIYDYCGDGGNYEAGQFNTTWAFVSRDNYESYYNKLLSYNAAEQLGALISQASEYGIDLTAAKSVYENTNSTVEEINAAKEALNKDILSYYEISVTPSSPKDLSHLISYPTCDAIDGWTNEINASTWNTQSWIDDSWNGFEGTTLNIWSASLNGKAYQKIENIPNGIYVVSLAAYSEKMNGYIYANDNNTVVTGAAPGNTYTVTTNVTDGTIEFGFGQDETGTNWVALDNSSLNFYGSGVEAYRFWLQNLLEDAPSFDDVTVQTELMEDYNNVLSSVNTAQTKEEILNIIPAYESILNDIKTNIAAYEELSNAKTAAEELLNNETINTYYSDQISDMISETIETVISNHSYSTEEVKTTISDLKTLTDEATSYINSLQELDNLMLETSEVYEEYNSTCSQSAVQAYNDFKDSYESLDFSEKTNEDISALILRLKEIKFNLMVPDQPASDDNPVNYTAKIAFPSFDNGAEGWTNDGFATCSSNTWTSFADGEVIDAQYLNLWNLSSAKVYQVINDLPNGAYTFQISAFANAEGLEIYANENSVPVTVGTNGDDAPCQYGNIYTVDVVVTDGTLEIGARNSLDSEIWAMIDNCVLTYYGTESQIITGIDSAERTANAQEAIYSVNGARVTTMRKGVNIVRMSDGTVKKVLVK